MSPVKASIIIPCYNEEACIKDVILEIEEGMKNYENDYEIIVIDDCSSDNSVKILETLNVKLIKNTKNIGAGSSRLVGVAQSKYEVIVYIDADSSYTSSDIPRLLRHFPESDHVIGYRDKEMGYFPFLRKTVKALARYMASILVWEYIADLNSGLRAFKKSKLKKHFHLLPNGFSCVTTMTVISYCLGHKVSYISTKYRPRVGKSKFHPITDTFRLFLTIFRTFFKLQKLKSLLLLLLITTSFSCVIFYEVDIRALVIILLCTLTYIFSSMWFSKDSMRFE